MNAMTSDLHHFEIDQQLFDLGVVEQTSAMHAGVRAEDLGIEMNRGVPHPVRQCLLDSPTATRP